RHSIFRGLVRNRNVEDLAEGLQRVVGQLLFLMRRIAGLRRPKSISFYGLRQDHGRRTSVFYSAQVRVVDLLRIVTAAMEVGDLFIAHTGDEFQQFGILAEKVLSRISAAFGFTRLVLAIHALFHALEQEARVVAGKQRIPIAAPNNFDYVPSRSPEHAFELIDDLAVS